jgi:hypothetical protein
MSVSLIAVWADQNVAFVMRARGFVFALPHVRGHIRTEDTKAGVGNSAAASRIRLPA